MKFLGKLISWFRPKKKIMTGACGTRMDEHLEKKKRMFITIGDSITMGNQYFYFDFSDHQWKDLKGNVKNVDEVMPRTRLSR